jgi:hypothetical protein
MGGEAKGRNERAFAPTSGREDEGEGHRRVRSGSSCYAAVIEYSGGAQVASTAPKLGSEEAVSALRFRRDIGKKTFTLPLFHSSSSALPLDLEGDHLCSSSLSGGGGSGRRSEEKKVEGRKKRKKRSASPRQQREEKRRTGHPLLHNPIDQLHMLIARPVLPKLLQIFQSSIEAELVAGSAGVVDGGTHRLFPFAKISQGREREDGMDERRRCRRGLWRVPLGRGGGKSPGLMGRGRT